MAPERLKFVPATCQGTLPPGSFNRDLDPPVSVFQALPEPKSPRRAYCIKPLGKPPMEQLAAVRPLLDLHRA